MDRSNGQERNGLQKGKNNKRWKIMPMEENNLMQEIIVFLKANPNPTDDIVHGWAEASGFDTEAVEETIYKIATAHAQQTENAQKINIEDQLNAGIKVEMEHTDDEAVAKQIAYDHLKEDPRYYIFLKEMEKLMKETASKTTYEKSVKMWQEKSSEYKPEIEDEDEYKKKQKELNEEKLTKKVEGEQKKALGVENTKLKGQESQLRKRIEKSSRDVIGR